MSRDSGSDGDQRTVAELLAEYGNSGGATPARRRRRRGDGDTASAPQTIIDRVLSDSGTLLPVRDQPATDRSPANPPAAAAPPAPPAVPLVNQPRPAPSRPALPPVGRPPVAPRPPGVADAELTDVHPPIVDAPATPPPGLPVAAPAAPPVPHGGPVPGPVPEDVTQELPLVDGSHDEPGGPTVRRAPVPPPVDTESTQAHPGPYLDDDLTDAVAPPAGGPVDLGVDLDAEPSGLAQHTAVFNPLADDPADDPAATAVNGTPLADEFDEHPPAVEPTVFAGHAAEPDTGFGPAVGDDPVAAQPAPPASSPGREWLVIAAQVGVGGLGGAVVWLGFSWLWGFLPAAALGAAVVVIVGLVLVVRRLRRADDLQTTVLAILAGLVVTVSPAALLLIRR